ncbi:MAG: PQQ-binding-like beta-propeller repeat protein [Planctomycetota bacterium]
MRMPIMRVCQWGLAGLLASLSVIAVTEFSSAAPATADAKGQAKSILDTTGVKGGLIVHLGCGDGQLTAALRANDAYLVHGLAGSAADVEGARKNVQKQGSYGRVWIEQFSGRELPYIDNLVNLLVTEDLGQVPMQEVLRVLAPRGVAYVKQGGEWKKTVKPVPKEYDDWTHYLYDARGNAVSRDTAVAPLRHLQWIGGPRYSRHHDHMSAASAMVAAGGRLFYIFDHANPLAIQIPSEWQLVARDAFNGTVLWRKAIDQWHTQMYKLKSGPVQLPRRVVAIDDKVYVTLGLEAPVSVLNAATGETIRVLDGTAKTEEIIYSDGTLFLLINDNPFRQPARPQELVYDYQEGPRRIAAYDAATGKQLWNAPQPNVLPGTLVADDKQVVLADGERIVSLDRKSGKKLWQSDPVQRRKVLPSFFAPCLVLLDDVVLFSGGSVEVDGKNATGGDNIMYALSADSGKTLWTGDHPASGYKSAEDILVMDGLAWTSEVTFGNQSGEMVGRDPKTGEVRKRFVPDVDTHWFHHRCYRAKATDNYLLMSRTGIEFVDPDTEHWECHHWVRGACLYGIMPANGMVYNAPHPCACYLEAKLYGFNALAPDSPTRQAPREVPAAGRLEKGPAFGKVSAASGDKSADWPTLRGDAARSGSTEQAVSTNPQKQWEKELGGRLSAPVIAEGKVFLAAIDEHTVHALDQQTGEPAWSFTAGGRIDSPPTIYQGMALFGSSDGFVYCLRAADGALVWRFRGAPVDRRMGSFEQIESVWPISGSVLIRDGELWCVAGRSLFLDGGLRLLRLDPATGRLIQEKVLDDRDPDSEQNLQVRLEGLNMPVALADVLAYDGEYVYMRSQRFDAEGNRHELEAPNRNVNEQFGEGQHLFSPTGLLDDAWWHRSYWVYGQVWKSGAGGYYQAGRVAPAGRPLVFDEQTVYGFARKPQYYKWTTPMEYQLFATVKEPERVSLTAKAGDDAKKGGKAKAKRKKQGGVGAPAEAKIATDWTEDTAILARAMVLAKDTIFVAGPPDLIDEEQSLATFADASTQQQLARQEAAYEGAEGARLGIVSATDGSKIAEIDLDAVPVFDGMAAAGGKLFMTTIDGKVVCLGGR